MICFSPLPPRARGEKDNKPSHEDGNYILDTLESDIYPSGRPCRSGHLDAKEEMVIIATHVLHAPRIEARFRWQVMYLMTKTGATRTLDNARDRLEIDLPVHPLESSGGIAWEHRRKSEQDELRHGHGRHHPVDPKTRI